ncbi:MAG: DUF6281 family protein [Thermoleophilaceae bacterium]
MTLETEREDDKLVSLEEIRETLRAHEGPARPRVRRHVREYPRLKRAATLLAGLLALGGVVAVFAYRPGSSGEDAECRHSLEYKGVPYSSVGLREASTLVLGARIGEGQVPGCSDEPDVPEPQPERIGVVRIKGVPPSVAVGQAGVSTRFYMAEGRCADPIGWRGLERCLRETLTFAGHRYTASMFDEARSLARRPLAGEGTIETALGERRPVELARLEGIDPSRAVAVPALGMRTLYLAEGQCYVGYANGGMQDLLACLREGMPKG